MIPRYTLPEAAAIWTDQRRYELWLEVELAACAAMVKYKMIPEASYKKLAKKAKVNPKRIMEIEETVKHDILAFTMQIEEDVGKDAQYLHFGLTSSDVLDTALALQLREACDLIMKELKALQSSVKKLALKTKKIPAVGRSHGIHAEPLSFGVRFLGFFAELERNRVRLERAREAICYGQFSGAVGSYGTLSPKLEKEACRILKLKPETVSTQVIPRDRHAEFFNALALLASSIERMSVELRHLQRTEVNEAQEGFSKGQKGSSAMPHKRNPISAENLTGCARLMRGWAQAAMENIALWHERDISHSSVERVIGPDACILMHYMCVRMRRVIDGLQVNKEDIKRNLDHTRGLVWSGGVLLAFVKKGMARDAAYRLVQRHALEAWRGGDDLVTRLSNDEEALKFLSKKQLQDEFADDRGLKYVEDIYKRGLQSLK